MTVRCGTAKKPSCGMMVTGLTCEVVSEPAWLCRIGIMARGRLRCIGNSLRLKSRFGSGYRISVRVQVCPYPGGGCPPAMHM